MVNSLLDQHQHLNKQLKEREKNIDRIGDNIEAIHSKLDKRIFYEEESKSMDNKSVTPDEIVFEEAKSETRGYLRGNSKKLQEVNDFLKDGNDELESELRALSQNYSLDDSMAQGYTGLKVWWGFRFSVLTSRHLSSVEQFPMKIKFQVIFSPGRFSIRFFQ